MYPLNADIDYCLKSGRTTTSVVQVPRLVLRNSILFWFNFQLLAQNLSGLLPYAGWN